MATDVRQLDGSYEERGFVTLYPRLAQNFIMNTIKINANEVCRKYRYQTQREDATPQESSNKQ